MLQTVERSRLETFDQRRGRERQRDHQDGERRQAKAGGDDRQQQRDDERREREQEDGDCGDGVAGEPRRRAAGHDTCRHAKQQRQDER